MNKVNELGLAIWYCDDGSYHITKRIVRIMTDSFSFDEQKLIQKWFKERWGLKCDIVKRKSGNFHIGFNSREGEKFLNILKDYVPKPMLYKLGHLWEGNKERLKMALEKESAKAKKYYLKNKEKILKKQQEYLKKPETIEQVRLSKQIYYKKNRERIIERCRLYQKANKKAIKEYKQKYYRKNTEREKERKRKYYLRNREKILKKQKTYQGRPEIKERKRIYDKERYKIIKR